MRESVSVSEGTVVELMYPASHDMVQKLGAVEKSRGEIQKHINKMKEEMKGDT